jgi:hypothetical protein
MNHLGAVANAGAFTGRTMALRIASPANAASSVAARRCVPTSAAIRGPTAA